MKNDTQHRPGVSKTIPLGAPGKQVSASPRKMSDGGSDAEVSAPTLSSPPSITLSARYIDSRLKQFCWR